MNTDGASRPMNICTILKVHARSLEEKQAIAAPTP